MGVIRFSAVLIEWSEIELNDVKRLCVQAYKNAWHLPRSTSNALFIFPKTHAGKESILPMAVLTQELLLHTERRMRHEDVSKNLMLAGLNRTLDEWLCDSFATLIEKMELWKWDDATGDFWSRLAKALQQSNIRVSVTWAEQLLAKTPKTENSNLHGFEVHRPSSKGTELLFQVIKAIINQDSRLAYQWKNECIPMEK